MKAVLWLLALAILIAISMYARSPDPPVKPSSIVEKPELIVAGAAWCAPCQTLHKIMLKKAIKEILKGYDYTHLDYTVEDEKKEIERLGVRVFPTIIISRSGEEVYRKSGAPSEEELKKLLKKNL